MNFKQSGETFEYGITTILLEYWDVELYDEYSNKQYKKWRNNYKLKYYNIISLEFLDRPLFIRIVPDYEGIYGNTSDLELIYNVDQKPIGISLKHNNLSLKHPHPLGLSKYLTKKESMIYIKKYKIINSKWNDKISIYLKYNDIDKDMIYELYSDYVDILYNALISSDICIQGILKFCLSINNKTQYIMYKICKTDDVIVLEHNPNIVLNNFKVKRVSQSTIIILIDTLSIKMRLHTSKSKISNNINLKYDVTCINNNQLFNIIV
jgi:hypothetical protein